MADNRTYKARIESARGSLSPAAIRQAKNGRCKARRQEAKATLQAEANAKVKAWQSKNFAGQLTALDVRLGKGKGATKQRARLAKKISDEKNK